MFTDWGWFFLLSFGGQAEAGRALGSPAQALCTAVRQAGHCQPHRLSPFPWFCLFHAGSLWASYLCSLNLCFLFRKKGVMIAPTTYRSYEDSVT